MLRDAIETSRRVLGNISDFDTEGKIFPSPLTYPPPCNHLIGLQCAEAIKNEFDTRWSPHWHVIIGRNFGSFVTHETKCFVFFYLEDKAVMLFKAG